MPQFVRDVVVADWVRRLFDLGIGHDMDPDPSMLEHEFEKRSSLREKNAATSAMGNSASNFSSLTEKMGPNSWRQLLG